MKRFAVNIVVYIDPYTEFRKFILLFSVLLLLVCNAMLSIFTAAAGRAIVDFDVAIIIVVVVVFVALLSYYIL